MTDSQLDLLLLALGFGFGSLFWVGLWSAIIKR